MWLYLILYFVICRTNAKSIQDKTINLSVEHAKATTKNYTEGLNTHSSIRGGSNLTGEPTIISGLTHSFESDLPSHLYTSSKVSRSLKDNNNSLATEDTVEGSTETTTTHPVTSSGVAEKRASGTNYSYYYLGRKLWYIPLYFSIYFMFYVTALVLKAIARHKIEFKHGSSRSFDGAEDVDDVNMRVADSLEKSHKLYTAFGGF